MFLKIIVKIFTLMHLSVRKTLVAPHDIFHKVETFALNWTFVAFFYRECLYLPLTLSRP